MRAEEFKIGKCYKSGFSQKCIYFVSLDPPNVVASSGLDKNGHLTGIPYIYSFKKSELKQYYTYEQITEHEFLEDMFK